MFNLFEKLVTIQSNRLIQQKDISREKLMEFTVKDILLGKAKRYLIIHFKSCQLRSKD
jgi:hypothetical protein